MQTILTTFQLLQRDETEPLHDIRLVTILRFWGEVLVGEEYSVYVKRIKRMGLNERNSHFFWPHYKHDTKQASFHTTVDLNTHSDQFTVILQRLLITSEMIDFCAAVTKSVSEVRMGFYDQFKK